VIGLVESLEVSDMTIRRGFRELENLGLIRRFHGGAVSSRGRGYERTLLFDRKIENQIRSIWRAK
ncbi:MAG: DeoR family transcriptional regulator, partial [Clostridiaceae bacterium]|nr:DeoR family transcriptional regulator [Clostridiaceae bacterium]